MIFSLKDIHEIHGNDIHLKNRKKWLITHRQKAVGFCP